MSIWLNWIERSTSNREVPSSSLGLDLINYYNYYNFYYITIKITFFQVYLLYFFFVLVIYLHKYLILYLYNFNLYVFNARINHINYSIRNHNRVFLRSFNYNTIICIFFDII